MRQDALTAIRTRLTAKARPTMAELADAAGVSVATLYRAFGSRAQLLSALDMEAGPSARARILDRAIEMVGRAGLEQLSMDELADAAGVSRANVYRLFPGKPALFRELVRNFSPWQAAAKVIESTPDRAPQQVIPEIARAFAGALEGRVGLLLSMVSQVQGENASAAEAMNRAAGQGVHTVLEYLDRRMAAGQLRRMDPILAGQLLVGPIAIHLLTLPLAKRAGLRMSTPDAIDEITRCWLRALAP